MKRLFLVGCCLMAAAGTIMAADKPACEVNFASGGSFLTGKSFKTWQEYPGLSQTDAYKNVYQKIVSDGWRVNSSDKEMGMLSVTQEVSYGSGKAAPMNVLVESLGSSGSKITITFGTSGAVAVKASALRDKFCSYLTAVAQSERK